VKVVIKSSPIFIPTYKLSFTSAIAIHGPEVNFTNKKLNFNEDDSLLGCSAV
jgi:hypothetical protein